VNRSGRPGDGRHSERPWASALFEIAITKYPGRACLAFTLDLGIITSLELVHCADRCNGEMTPFQ
jgi:hypothetical protein